MEALIFDELERARLNRLPQRARRAIIKLTDLADNMFWPVGDEVEEATSLYELAAMIYDKEVLYRKF